MQILKIKTEKRDFFLIVKQVTIIIADLQKGNLS